VGVAEPRCPHVRFALDIQCVAVPLDAFGHLDRLKDEQPLGGDHQVTVSHDGDIAVVHVVGEVEVASDNAHGELGRQTAQGLAGFVGRTVHKDHAEIVHFYHAPEGMYLAWFSPPGIDAPAAWIMREARVMLSEGSEFSAGTTVDTTPFVRLNFATSRDTLSEILDRISRVLPGP
jgi:hypothetical protein